MVGSIPMKRTLLIMGNTASADLAQSSFEVGRRRYQTKYKYITISNETFADAAAHGVGEPQVLDSQRVSPSMSQAAR